MSHTIQVGDFVQISLENNLEYYEIIEITDKIIISDVDSPENMRILINNDEEWKVYGTDKPYKIIFFSSEEYSHIIQLNNFPINVIFEIGLNLDLGTLSSMCRVNKKFNKILCGSNYFWECRYRRDFGVAKRNVDNWKQAYYNFINGVWLFGVWERYESEVARTNGCLKPTQNPGINAKYASSGGDHTILIDQDDNVMSFGCNLFGQLGLGDETSRFNPVQIPGVKAKYVSAGVDYTILIDQDDNVWLFGIDELGLRPDEVDNCLIPAQIHGIKAKYISAGASHTILIDQDDNVWSFGSNTFGQLGFGDREEHPSPTQIPEIKAKCVSAGWSFSIILGYYVDSLDTKTCVL